MPEGETFEILVLNDISQVGLKRFPAERYRVAKEAARPDAILLRSQDLHDMNIAPSVKAIGRAGAGTNNIPVNLMSERGVPVFNAPGANANAVKELVLAGMLIAARNLAPALEFVRALERGDEALERRVEDGKRQFAGMELARHTLGVIGLGRVGRLVADAAIHVGMNVLGYDPDITVDAARGLPAQVKRAHSIVEVLQASHFVTLHVPLLPQTRKLINAHNLKLARPGTVLLNFSRDGIVDSEAVVQALEAHKLKCYVTDFPASGLLGVHGVVALPHLGASTREAEENSAVMVAEQVREYLENGNVSNAVNFPDMSMARESLYRIAIANANVPNMVAQISATIGKAGLNIHDMLNKSRGKLAYTLVDIDSAATRELTARLGRIDGVLAVRYLPLRS
jgi:D-3-phosphoglycerate dehydrogenase / 2-oxoglutarate reductase